MADIVDLIIKKTLELSLVNSALSSLPDLDFYLLESPFKITAFRNSLVGQWVPQNCWKGIEKPPILAVEGGLESTPAAWVTRSPDYLNVTIGNVEDYTRKPSLSVALPARWEEDDICKTAITHLPCCANICHLVLWPCSDKSRLLSLMTTLAKSVSSTKSEVMMLTPSIPGLWASTQDMIAGRFLESRDKKDTHSITNTLKVYSVSEPPAEQHQEVRVCTQGR